MVNIIINENNSNSTKSVLESLKDSEDSKTYEETNNDKSIEVFFEQKFNTNNYTNKSLSVKRRILLPKSDLSPKDLNLILTIEHLRLSLIVSESFSLIQTLEDLRSKKPLFEKYLSSNAFLEYLEQEQLNKLNQLYQSYIYSLSIIEFKIMNFDPSLFEDMSNSHSNSHSKGELESSKSNMQDLKESNNKHNISSSFNNISCLKSEIEDLKRSTKELEFAISTMRSLILEKEKIRKQKNNHSNNIQNQPKASNGRRRLKDTNNTTPQNSDNKK